MVRIIFFTFFSVTSLLFPCSSQAQNIGPERITGWSHAGLTMDIQAPENQVNIIDFGADNTGVNSSNSAYTAAIANLNGAAGTIYFPQGDYFFTATISVPDSVFLKGESTSTQLNFDQGGTGNLIQLTGTVISTEVALAADGIKGMYQIELADASALVIGDIIRIGMFDEDLMFSSWAYGTLGQIIEVIGIDGNTLTLADPLNHHYPLSRNPFARKLNAIRAAGVECLTINRLDNSAVQESNIYIHAGFNCVTERAAKPNYSYLRPTTSAKRLESNVTEHSLKVIRFQPSGFPFNVSKLT